MTAHAITIVMCTFCRLLHEFHNLRVDATERVNSSTTQVIAHVITIVMCTFYRLCVNSQPAWAGQASAEETITDIMSHSQFHKTRFHTETCVAESLRQELV